MRVLTIGKSNLSIYPGSRQVFRGKERIELTKTEYDLLEYLMRNKDVVLTRERILDAVWERRCSGGSNIVDVYIRYVRNRIHDRSEPKLIETVRGIGYVIRDKTRR